MLREIITPYFIWGVILFEGSVTAGIPNVAGEFAVTGGKGFENMGVAGPFYTGAYLKKSGYAEASSKIDMYYKGMSLQLANAIYGNSTTVTPLSLSTKFFIKY